MQEGVQVKDPNLALAHTRKGSQIKTLLLETFFLAERLLGRTQYLEFSQPLSLAALATGQFGAVLPL